MSEKRRPQGGGIVFGLALLWCFTPCDTIAGLSFYQLDPVSSVGSKPCSTADFRPSPFWTHNERARQSSLASCSRAHPLQSRCTHRPNSEWQCSCVPVVLLHPTRWCAISNEILIIHIWLIVPSYKPRYRRQACCMKVFHLRTSLSDGHSRIIARLIST